MILIRLYNTLNYIIFEFNFVLKSKTKYFFNQKKKINDITKKKSSKITNSTQDTKRQKKKAEQNSLFLERIRTYVYIILIENTIFSVLKLHIPKHKINTTQVNSICKKDSNKSLALQVKEDGNEVYKRTKKMATLLSYSYGKAARTTQVPPWRLWSTDRYKAAT